MSSKLVCLVRSIPVQDTPEERVRQHLLSHLIGAFGCPRSLIGVEVPLQSLVGCCRRPVPRRRMDIVCFFLDRGALSPLLVIECKASKPLPGAVSQLNGYNFFIHAPLVALAWPGALRISHLSAILYEGDPAFSPTYHQAQEAAASALHTHI